MNTKNKIFIPLSFDLMFKKIFGDNAKIERLEALISLYFGIPYEAVHGNIKIINNESRLKIKNDKRTSVDILAVIELVSGKGKINIEINRSKVMEIIVNRNLKYAAGIFASGLKNKQNYDLIESVTQINFDVIEIDKNNKNIIDKYYLQNDNKHKLTNLFQIHHVNIERCKKIWYDKTVKNYSEEEQRVIKIGTLISLEERDDFIKCLEEIDMSEEIKIDTLEAVDDFNSDEELLIYYDKEKDEEAIRNGELSASRRQGFNDGINEEKIIIAKNLLKQHIDINVISQATDLSIEELNNLN